MSYNQGSTKDNVMSQSMNYMKGGQGKLLHMGITYFRFNKVLAQIIYDMLMDILILLNQNHTNHLHGCDDINQEIMAIFRWTKHRGRC